MSYRIIGCSILVGILLWVAWNWDDSIYLRFVMLGMGVLSALYAVWDIALDGIKYAEVTESDATLMAEVYNHTIQEHNRRVSYDERPLSDTYRKPQHPHHPKRERGARCKFGVHCCLARQDLLRRSSPSNHGLYSLRFHMALHQSNCHYRCSHWRLF